MATTAKTTATKLMETVAAPDLFGVGVGVGPTGPAVPVGTDVGAGVAAQLMNGGTMNAGP
jgi:hypothetical protein